MSLLQIISFSLSVARASLEPVNVLVFITVLLVLFMVALGWRVINAVLDRYNRPPRRRR